MRRVSAGAGMDGLHVPFEAARQAAHASPVPADSIASLLGELSQGDFAALMSILDAPAAGRAERAAQLLTAAAGEAQAGRLDSAADDIRQAAALDPAGVQAASEEPALESVRPVIFKALHELTAASKLNAEGRLAEVAVKAGAGVPVEVGGRTWNSATLLTLAGRLAEAGGLVNFERSAAISEVLLDALRWAPGVGGDITSARERQVAWGLSPRWFAVLCIALVLTAVLTGLKQDNATSVWELAAAGLLLLALIVVGSRLRR